MRAFNIHEAKSLSLAPGRRCAKGEPFIVAKAGDPLFKVMSLDTPSGAQIRRPGFLAGQIAVPKDFDRLRSAEIEKPTQAGTVRGCRHVSPPQVVRSQSIQAKCSVECLKQNKTTDYADADAQEGSNQKILGEAF
jgi:antitoxin (DNA-binding transcriptional repressor) of toxin-antitoxin stability system